MAPGPRRSSTRFSSSTLLPLSFASPEPSLMCPQSPTYFGRSMPQAEEHRLALVVACLRLRLPLSCPWSRRPAHTLPSEDLRGHRPPLRLRLLRSKNQKEKTTHARYVSFDWPKRAWHLQVPRGTQVSSPSLPVAQRLEPHEINDSWNIRHRPDDAFGSAWR